MAWIRRYKPKKLTSKISDDSNFTFSRYAWLCVVHCSNRLLCIINSRVRDFLWKLLSFHAEMISALFLWGSVLFWAELRKYAKNSNFENFESALYSKSGSMPLNQGRTGSRILDILILQDMTLFCALEAGDIVCWLVNPSIAKLDLFKSTVCRWIIQLTQSISYKNSTTVRRLVQSPTLQSTIFCGVHSGLRGKGVYECHPGASILLLFAPNAGE